MHRVRIPFLPLLLALLPAMLLGGCMGGSSTIPRDHYYRLPPGGTSAPHPRARLNGSLEIGSLQASGMLNERAILFVREQQPLEINPYHYYYWVNAPASLVQRHLLEYLRHSGLAEEVYRYRADSPADFRLDGSLLHFERHLGKNGVTAEVELELLLRDNRRDRLLLRRHYRQRQAAGGGDMADTARAFGEALEAIYARFSRDLAQTLAANSP